VTSVGDIVATILWLYFVILLARFVIDLIQMLSKQWQPAGLMLVICEIIFTVTDPPIRLLRKVIPPVRVGSVSLDLSFLVLVIILQILIQLAVSFG
jgi:YggT family protein